MYWGSSYKVANRNFKDGEYLHEESQLKKKKQRINWEAM